MNRAGLMRALALAATLWSVVCFAASDLDELLQQTRTQQNAQAALAAERAATYKAADASTQERLLKEALAARGAAEAASQAVLERYNANELRIGELNTQLKGQLASLGLGEVFGLTRQVAGDTASVLEQSMITAELVARGEAGDRAAYLRQLSAADNVPAPSDIERLWTELLNEMTLSGRVSKFQSEVALPDGQQKVLEVVRVGPFIASAGRDFLSYIPELKSFVRLSRQPPDALRDHAAALAAANAGTVKAVVDPARGALLEMYVERPNWIERLDKGGEVTLVIIAVGLFGAALWVLQFIYLVYVRIMVWLQLRDLGRLSKWNPLGRVLLAFKGDASRIEQDADIAELRISEAVLREVPRLERFQAFLRLAVAAGPLLGLIGTVIGMIITFQAITESGSSDPKLMANGIGQAMIATVAGLGIAIPLLFGNAMLATLSRGIVQILDEQSTGLLAATLEQDRRA